MIPKEIKTFRRVMFGHVGIYGTPNELITNDNVRFVAFGDIFGSYHNEKSNKK